MTPCPYCDSHGKFIRIFDRLGSEEVKLWSCSRCASEFLYPQPSNDWLAKEYAGYFRMRQGRIPASKSKLCQLIISQIGELPPSPLVLEIGGGEGFFVKELQAIRPDAQITLVEPQADTSLFPAERVEVHKMLIEEWLNSTQPHQYDVIIAMDLIEHLRNPKAVIEQISKNHLKPGGRLVITTPDAGSLFRHALGRSWPHYKVEHLTYPSKGALTSLASQSKLQVLKLKSLAKPLQLGYLVAVLSNFGPRLTRFLGRIADILIPNYLRRFHVTIPSGELLFVTKKAP